MIVLTPEQLATVKGILGQRVPGIRVLAFGSRVTGKAKPHSDLDIAIDADTSLSLSQLGALKEDFSHSDLPFRVDVVDLKKIAETFRKIILQEYDVIQEKKW